MVLRLKSEGVQVGFLEIGETARRTRRRRVVVEIDQDGQMVGVKHSDDVP